MRKDGTTGKRAVSRQALYLSALLTVPKTKNLQLPLLYVRFITVNKLASENKIGRSELLSRASVPISPEPNS